MHDYDLRFTDIVAQFTQTTTSIERTYIYKLMA